MQSVPTGQWLQREGLMPLLEGSRQLMNRRYVDLFGDREIYDRTGEVVLDDNKLTRIFCTLSSDPDAKTAEEIPNVLSMELAKERAFP